MEEIKENCGIFGIHNHPHAGWLTYLGLYSLQHRGQESAGIVVYNQDKVNYHLGMGLVSDVFSPQILKTLEGNFALGHVRYSTTGSSSLKNAQPFIVEFKGQTYAIAHNGNLVNTQQLKEEMENNGTIFQTTTDSEIIIHKIFQSKKQTFAEKIIEAISSLKGAYSLLLSTQDALIAIRDPYGFRPLSLAKLDGTYVVASESCAFDLIKAEYIREIEPGEILFITSEGLKSIKPFSTPRSAFCIFEYIYFARPDSNIFGQNVYQIRKALGKQLALEHPVSADMVLPVPDSGNCAALGYAQQSRIPFEMGITRNHYVGRTFIQPSQIIRDLGVKIKLNPIREIVKGKRIVMVEDSIVRGTTSKSRIRTLKEAGAKEIHMRVSCPPHRYPCPYGIDFPSREELIASSKTVQEIRDFLGLDSLAYLSLEGMYKALNSTRNKFCDACFTGEYPILPEKGIRRF